MSDDTPEAADASASAEDGDGDGPAPKPPPPRLVPVEHPEGDRILVLSWVGTALLAVTSLLAVAVDTFELVSVPVALLLFAVGVVTFAMAYFKAVGRSRVDLIGIGGLYFLAGCAPRRVQLHLLGSFAVQVVVSFTAAALRPYTAIAFAVMAPMYGLGLSGLWAARYGTFPPRPQPEPGGAPEG